MRYCHFNLKRVGIQSTLPMRGATYPRLRWPWFGSYFNPRSPCGERPPVFDKKGVMTLISIHAPRAGSDPQLFGTGAAQGQFQSTLPVRGATGEQAKRGGEVMISIHAPRAGSDCIRLRVASASEYFNPRSPCGERRDLCFRGEEKCQYFNPRSPCGERPKLIVRAGPPVTFQSTLPVRGATKRCDNGGVIA